MMMFVLGFALGSGLVLAIQTLAALSRKRIATRRANFQAAVNAEVNRQLMSSNSWNERPSNPVRPTHPSHSIPSNW